MIPDLRSLRISPTDPSLLAALREASKHILTPEEIREQRVSFVMGMLGPSNNLTRSDVRKMIDDMSSGARPGESQAMNSLYASAGGGHTSRLDTDTELCADLVVLKVNGDDSVEFIVDGQCRVQFAKIGRVIVEDDSGEVVVLREKDEKSL